MMKEPISPAEFELQKEIAKQLFCSPVFIENVFTGARNKNDPELEKTVTDEEFESAAYLAWSAASYFIEAMRAFDEQ